MRNIKFAFGILLVICISVIHIHCSLFTVSNSFNPITIMCLLTRNDGLVYWLTGYSVQFLVTLLAAYFILKFCCKKLWLILYIVGAIIAYWISLHYPLSHLSIFQDSEIAKRYNTFYGYEPAFLYAVYYIALQFFVLFLYISLNYLLKSLPIAQVFNRIIAFTYYMYHIFIDSVFYEKACRNKYILGTVILLIVLLCLIIHMV